MFAIVVMIYLLLIRIKSHTKLLIYSTIQSKNLIAPLRTGSRKAGFGGLLSLLAVHAERRAGEELCGSAKIWNGVKPYDTAATRVEYVRSEYNSRPLAPKPHVQVNNSSKKANNSPTKVCLKKRSN